VNAAERLAGLLSRAREIGERSPTAQSQQIWSEVLGPQQDTAAFLQAIAEADKVIDETLLQVSFVDSQLIDSIGPPLIALHDLFTLESLVKPWRSASRRLGEESDLALRVCRNTLSGRIGERQLTKEQIAFIRSKLEELRVECTTDLPPALLSYLVQSIDEIELALDRYWLLGPQYLSRVTDGVVGTVAREFARRPDAPKEQVRLTKRLGAIAGALATAVTLSLGVVQLDQATIQLLPWGDGPNAQVVECVIQMAQAPPSILAQGESRSIQPPEP
jgi:hypothetical protein